MPIKAINKIAYRDFFLRSLLIKSLPKIAIPTMESIIILNLVKAVHKFQSQTTLFANIVTFIFLLPPSESRKYVLIFSIHRK